MFFASDNSGPAHPAVMQALADVNTGFAMPYGADDPMAAVTAELRRLFEAPEAAVYLVATGTAANSLSLATLTQPFETVFCSPVAHIHEDECNAPEFYTGGAKLTLVPAAFASQVSGDQTMWIDVRMPGLDQAQSDHLARALRQIIGVETVLVSLTPGAATDQSGAA